MLRLVKKTTRYDAEKLRRVWDRKKRELGINQFIAAERMGFNSQSSVSQYLNGRIPLNLVTAIKFAELLEVDLSEVWDGPTGFTRAVLGQMTREEIVEHVARQLTPEELAALIADLAQSLPGVANAKDASK